MTLFLEWSSLLGLYGRSGLGNLGPNKLHACQVHRIEVASVSLALTGSKARSFAPTCERTTSAFKTKKLSELTAPFGLKLLRRRALLNAAS
eukprot:1479305-Amphidinium_carterae.1